MDLQVFFEIYDWPPFVIALIASVAAVAAGAAFEMSVRACLRRPISPSKLALEEQEHHQQQEAEAVKLTDSTSLLSPSSLQLPSHAQLGVSETIYFTWAVILSCFGG